MSFNEKPDYPKDHPISEKRVRALMAGELGQQYFALLAQTCSPLYWHTRSGMDQSIIRSNGTLTYVQGAEYVFGVTAAHVVREYQSLAQLPGCVLQVGNAELQLDLIDIDDRSDLATLVIPDAVRARVGKPISPISLPRPHDVPQEGRGIMLAGFPGEHRNATSAMVVDWGMFGAVGISRRVNERQITWVPDHNEHVTVKGIPQLPPHQNLGGISGGPLIAWFEKAGGLLTYCSLAGVVVEANAELENVVAMRSEFIRPNGKLRPLG